MSFTISSYLNAVPSGSPEYPAAQQILSKITIAAGTANAPAANAAKQELPSLIGSFVNTLLDQHHISPATVLALVAAATNTGGRNVSDVGVTGNVAVSGSAITITAGVY